MSQVTTPTPQRAQSRRLVADSLTFSILMIGLTIVLQRGIGFCRSFYVCGQLSPAEVGRWDLGFHFLMMVAPLSVLGIPGSFGRYVVQYEKLGQVKQLLVQSLIVCLLLVVASSCLLWQLRQWLAQYCFGDASQADFIGLLACGLPLVVFFNYATSWFTAKRLNRLVIRLQTAQAIAFAVGCVAAFQLASVSAVGVLVAYFCSVSIGLILAAAYALQDQYDHDLVELDESQSLWKRILPFAMWVWASNALVNLFMICDRILLVNFIPESTEEVHSLIGQYHASLILPALLMAVGAMVGSTLIPYLSSDWEAKDRDAVTWRMNVSLQAVGAFSLLASVGVLLVAPLLFGGLWNNKYGVGESLLPMTLCYCGLAAISLVAQKYFWCIEKTWFGSAVMFAGLAANFIIGILLVGPFGLKGVVASTLIAHAFCLFALIAFSRRNGLAIERGTYIVIAAMLVVGLGAAAAVLSLIVLVALIFFTPYVFADPVKQACLQKLKNYAQSIPGVVR